MDLRIRRKSGLNVWPPFADISIAMLLVFLFFLLIQLVSNSKLIQRMILERKQQTIEVAFSKRFAKEIDAGIISIKRDGNLQRFRFSDRILFRTNKAILQPLGRNTLIAVGQLFLQHKKNEKGEPTYKWIQIEGHTDNVPIILPNRSNWELSSDRAIAVLRLYVDYLKMDPRIIQATGFAEFRPVSGDKNIVRANNTAVKRAKNRRIEIVLVYSETEEK